MSERDHHHGGGKPRRADGRVGTALGADGLTALPAPNSVNLRVFQWQLHWAGRPAG
jgi:hypothetical protein